MDKIEKVLTEMGYVDQIGGAVFYTPGGKKIKNMLEGRLRNSLNMTGAAEVEFPSIIDYSSITLDPLIKRGRVAQSFEVILMDDSKRYLARTCEELAAEYFFSGTNSNKAGIIYQISTKFRNENADELSFLKRCAFTMLDVYSYEKTGCEKYTAYNTVKNCFIECLESLGILFKIIPSPEGHDQGIFSEEIISSCTDLNGLELGHLYKLGFVYSSPYGLNNIMASYGLGIDRLFTAYIFAKITKKVQEGIY